MRIIKSIFIVISLSITVSSYAYDYREHCKIWSQIAESHMKDRQEGMAMSTQMDNLDKEIKRNEVWRYFREWEEAIIIKVYDTPHYTTEDMKTKAIEDFRDSVYLSCIKREQSSKNGKH